MNFWKRIRVIGSALVLGLWLIAVIAGWRQGEGDQPAKAPPCTTCGL